MRSEEGSEERAQGYRRIAAAQRRAGRMSPCFLVLLLLFRRPFAAASATCAAETEAAAAGQGKEVEACCNRQGSRVWARAATAAFRAQRDHERQAGSSGVSASRFLAGLAEEGEDWSWKETSTTARTARYLALRSSVRVSSSCSKVVSKVTIRRHDLRSS